MKEAINQLAGDDEGFTRDDVMYLVSSLGLYFGFFALGVAAGLSVALAWTQTAVIGPRVPPEAVNWLKPLLLDFQMWANLSAYAGAAALLLGGVLRENELVLSFVRGGPEQE